MSTSQFRFLQPLDVLILRGNRLFGDPGSFGESLVPPWPSVAAGALRSRILTDDGVDLASFASGRIKHPTLGTPEAPGSFAITHFNLARRIALGAIETLHPAPADLVLNTGDEGSVGIACMQPKAPAPGLLSSSPLPQLAVLADDRRAKHGAGYWLNTEGWQSYLAGRPVVAKQHLVKSEELWGLDPRVGVGLDEATRRAVDGKLFTVQAVAFRSNVGFLVGASGAELPVSATVRFGGDGRAAAVHEVTGFQPVEPDYKEIARSGRCRIVLTSPGLFPEGWKLPGVGANFRWRLNDVAATLVAAAVPRAEIVSGWDLAAWRPKAAQRVAPTGSVYWLDDLKAAPDELRKLAAAGLWPREAHNASRRAEGFNRFTFAVA